MTTATIDDILPRLHDVHKVKGGGWKARCPAHDDANPSLSVKVGDAERVLLHCFAGCEYADIMAALGFSANGNGRGPATSTPPTPKPTAPKPTQPARRIVATYNYRDAAGQVIFQKVRYEPKSFAQRRPDGRGGYTWGLDDVAPVLYRLPELIDPATSWQPVYICEGEQDVDRVAGLGLVATCNFDGASAAGQKPKWRPEYNQHFAGRVVYILADNDEPGRAHAQNVARNLHSVAQAVKVVNLPGLPPKGDVSDWLDAGHTKDDLERVCLLTPLWEPTTDDAADNPTQPPGPTAALLPVIIANNRQLRELSDDAYSVLLAANDPPQVYQYGGQLARVTAADGRAGVQLLDPTMLRYRLSRVADFMAVKMLKDGTQQQSWVIPSDRLIADILAYPEWPDMPALSGVVTGPVVGPSGQVRVEAGYDPATGLYYHAGDALVIGDIEPTPERVAWAAGLILDDLLGDFPFKDAASRANAVALLLLPFARPSIEGCTPLHILNAPTPGTGKTLAARVATLPFNPDGPAVMTAGQDEDEWRKRITSLLSGGTSHLLIDNIKGALVSGSLAAALSTSLWTDRILGKSQTITLPNRAVWIATGNNIAVDTEMARRSVWIRLDSNAERPWTRNGFKHASLGEWALENRGDLVTAALVLIRHWFNIGCPSGRPTIGGFESWARVIGGILDAAGIGGFMGNTTELYELSDPTAALWAAFVKEWFRQFGDNPVGVKELYPLADSEPGKDKGGNDIEGLGLLDELLSGDRGGHTVRGRKVKLGNLIRGRVDTVIDGFKIDDAGELRRASQYRLVQLGV